MAISSITTIKDRIKSATESSKIAIFTIKRGDNIHFDAVFDNTVLTQKRLKIGDKSHIGSFYGSKGADVAGSLMLKL